MVITAARVGISDGKKVNNSFNTNADKSIGLTASPEAGTSNRSLVPIFRLNTPKTFLASFSIRCRALVPMMVRSLRKATTLGRVRRPISRGLAKTWMRPPVAMAMAELVVPRSMPRFMVTG